MSFIQTGFIFFAWFATLVWLFVSFCPIGRREIVELQKGGGGGKTIILLAGYAMPVESWEWFIKNCLRSQDRVLGFRRRYQENYAWWLWPIGWAPIKWQKREVAVMMQRLITADQKPDTQYVVIGHSFGCTMTRHLIRKFPKRIKKGVLIAPPTTARRGFLFNPLFWLTHGFRAVFPSLGGVIRFWQGYGVGPNAFLDLFSNGDLDHDQVNQLVTTQVPESPIVFYSHLLFERGLDLRIATHQGWHGQLSYVICGHDKIFRANDIQRDAYLRPGGKVFTLPRTPHCFWLMPTHPKQMEENAKILHRAVYDHDIENDNVIPVDFTKNR